MVDGFLEDVGEGRIQFRDKWQFELKSEFYPFSESKGEDLVQEFYFFIPNSLQINDQTYSKAQFYQDQTNLIRLKTPRFTFSELSDPLNPESPLSHIRRLLNESSKMDLLLNEIKLFGSVFRTSLRDWIADADLDKVQIEKGCEELEHLMAQYRNLMSMASTHHEVKQHFNYVDEYLSLTFNDYLLSLLEKVRLVGNQKDLDNLLTLAILKEKQYRAQHTQNGYPVGMGSEQKEEYILYRKALLSKFVIDPLLLWTSRASVDQRYRTLIGGIPAAIAMLIFLLLYVWQGSWLIINSQPFILFTVIIYVLKDRLKEELRYFSYRQVAKWFSDYTTDIRKAENGPVLGTLKEYVSMIKEKAIPAEIAEIRNRLFHQVLEEIKRPERVLYCKKSITLNKKHDALEERFYGFNTFFRLDIHHFLAKAEDPFHNYRFLDEKTLQLNTIQLPRVYHINIIMKSRKRLLDDTIKEELNKFRLVLDKSGIKRIEEV